MKRFLEYTPRGRGEHTGGNEELGSVGVLSGISHGKETRLGVLQLEVLVCVGKPVQETVRTGAHFGVRTFELLAVNGLSTGSGAYQTVE